jgi:16S rRNA (uracil1498-N3)-methyltransferase
MECLYYPEQLSTIKDMGSTVELLSDEARHARSLRLRVGDSVLLTSGKGVMLESEVSHIDKKSVRVQVLRDVSKDYKANQLPFHLYCSPLSDNTRFEFLIEKAVELGALTINLFKSDYSEFRSIRLERLKAKAIAALKQSKNTWLPIIQGPEDFDSIIKKLTLPPTVLLGDPDGESLSELIPELQSLVKSDGEPVVIIGPEGGLSDSELLRLDNLDNLRKLKISPRRLRSETAAVSLMSVLAGMG